MSLYLVVIFSSLLVVLELVYFKIADKFNIIDKPNHRSSHTKVTIRGGGVIFTLSLILGSAYLGLQYSYFLIGLVLISLVSFADDINPTSSQIRISVHLISVALMFYQLGMYSQPILLILLGLFFVIGSINAINFMDGINGITGTYGLVALFSLFYINRYVVAFTVENYLIFPIIALLVFNFFNFRKKAKCFAGDVGSVSIAFIILFFLLQLIIKTNNVGYILLLLMYGLDAAITLMLRVYRKEKVFEAHRSHFYQILVNEKGMSHLVVASLYGVLQIAINAILIVILPLSAFGWILMLVAGVIIYIAARIGLEGTNALFAKQRNTTLP